MASSSSSNAKKIVLTSSDKKSHGISESAAMLSGTIKNILEDASDVATAGIPLDNVESKTLEKVIEFCHRYAAKPPAETLKQFNKEFLGRMNKEELFDLVQAANYLHIEVLLDVLSQAIADQIKNKSIEFVREYFGIDNDYTPEEEKEIREETAWAFENIDP